jgi:hypothetical protein
LKRVKVLREFHSSDEAFRKYIRIAIAEELVYPGSREETLATLTEPYCPPQVKEFFDFLQGHITLQSNGMGVGLRENRTGVAELLSKFGWDYPIYRPLVDAFEEALLDTHYKMKEDTL